MDCDIPVVERFEKLGMSNTDAAAAAFIGCLTAIIEHFSANDTVGIQDGNRLAHSGELCTSGETADPCANYYIIIHNSCVNMINDCLLFALVISGVFR